MFKKFGFLAALGAGYVLGARAGRERYDQISAKARGLWNDPRVQEKADQAQHLAKEKAEQAQHLAKEKAEKAQHLAKEKMGGSSDDTSTSTTRTSGAGIPDPGSLGHRPGSASSPGATPTFPSTPSDTLPPRSGNGGTSTTGGTSS